MTNEFKDFIDKVILSGGISGSASIVRAIFVPAEGSSWSKFLKIVGSMLFGGMISLVIRCGDPNSFAYRYVDYLTIGITLAASEIVTIWVRRTISVVIVFIESKLVPNSKKDDTDVPK